MAVYWHTRIKLWSRAFTLNELFLIQEDTAWETANTLQYVSVLHSTQRKFSKAGTQVTCPNGTTEN